MTRLLTLLLLTATAFAASSGPLGFRGDGSARAPDASPPAGWSTTWTTPLGGRGNASPVVTGNRVLVTVEPDQLVSVDLGSGAIHWRRASPVLDTLDPAVADPIRGLVAQAPALEAEQAELRRQHSEKLRAFRAGDPSVTQADLDTISARVGGVRQLLETIAPYRAPDTHDDVGYASPTAVTDGRSAWVLFGTGVAASYSLDGQRRWTRWLGPPQPAKHGYSGTDAASPVLAGGVLVVPYRHLMGLHPDTGALRWTGPAWPHYGSPAVTTVGGRPVVLTPAGEVVDAASGRVLASGLGEVYYTSPVADGELVWYVGSNASYNANVPNRGRAWRLSASAEGVTATALWDVEISSRDRIYSVPVLHAGRLYVVTRNKQLLVIDATTGDLLSQNPIAERYGEAWAPTVLAGTNLFAASITGTIYELSPQPPFGLVREHTVSPNASTPWFGGTMVLWRGRDVLVRYGP